MEGSDVSKTPAWIAFNANVSRLQQLVRDATLLHDAMHDFNIERASYWGGFADGLKRAIMVLEGKG